MLRRMSIFSPRKRGGPVVAPTALDAAVAAASEADLARADELAVTAAEMLATPHVTAAEMFVTVPLELFDDPVGKVRTSFAGRSFGDRVRLTLGFLLEIGSHVLVLLAIFTALVFYRRELVFPELGTRSLDDPNDSWIYGLDRGFFATTVISSPAVMLYLLFGSRARGVLIGAVAFAASFSIAWGLVEAYGSLNAQIKSAPYFVTYAIVAVAGGEYVRRRVNDRVHLYYTLPVVLGSVVMALYSLQLPRIFALMTTDLQRALFRLLVHPLIFEVCLLLTRVGTRNLGTSKPYVWWTLRDFFEKKNCQKNAHEHNLF
jgi:hypothetical protein